MKPLARIDTSARASTASTASTAPTATTAPTAHAPLDDGAMWRLLVADASAPYRAAGRCAWHFARGKLRFDPVFAHVMRNGLIRPGDRVLDVGCGQGLLASLVDAAGRAVSAARWPASWRAAPLGARVTGIDIAPREVARARVALGSHATFLCADMRDAALPASDVVLLLDALHYIAPAEQEALLARVRDVLAPAGRVVMRIGDAAAARHSRFARAVDHVVAFVRRGRVVPQSTRPAAAWVDALDALGFSVQRFAMGQGTPFANMLLVATRKAAADERAEWPSR